MLKISLIIDSKEYIDLKTFDKIETELACRVAEISNAEMGVMCQALTEYN